jgi:hypothetical protein
MFTFIFAQLHQKTGKLVDVNLSDPISIAAVEHCPDHTVNAETNNVNGDGNSFAQA